MTQTLRHRVAALLEARANEWIDGRELAAVGGFAAWRTRLSECRRERGWRIDNRWRTVETPAGRRRVTEYRLVGEFDGSGVA